MAFLTPRRVIKRHVYAHACVACTRARTAVTERLIRAFLRIPSERPWNLAPTTRSHNLRRTYIRSIFYRNVATYCVFAINAELRSNYTGLRESIVSFFDETSCQIPAIVKHFQSSPYIYQFNLLHSAYLQLTINAELCSNCTGLKKKYRFLFFNETPRQISVIVKHFQSSSNIYPFNLLHTA